MSATASLAAEPTFVIKGRMQTLTVLRLNSSDWQQLQAELEAHLAQAPQLLKGMPLVIDCGDVAEKMPGIADLLNRLRELGLSPIAIQNARTDVADQATKLGLAVLRENKESEKESESAVKAVESAAKAESQPSQAPEQGDIELAEPKTTPMTITRPVRSGQQIYARGGDLVVLATVSAGAEVIADGHVHIYGALNGRAIAGAAGDGDARIFCSNFNAELVAIAGRYKTSDASNDQYRDTAVQIALDGEQLVYKALN